MPPTEPRSGEGHALATTGAGVSEGVTHPEVDPIAAGAVIAGRYRLERAVGAGGMATVWEATHLALNRTVAVKFIHLASAHTSQVRERFLREARVAAAVRHRNVVDILDFGTAEDGRPFMVMERLVGRSLGERMDASAPITLDEAAHIMTHVLSGLAAVHDAGIVHRDLKPENVFLVEEDGVTRAKLLDFGVSRAIDPRGELESVLPTVENLIVGTPQYMSPEQARGLLTIDHRSDLFSAGVILFELLTGTLPFDAEAPGDIIIQIATSDPPDILELRPDLPEPLVEVVRRAMRRQPGERFQSAREMQAALVVALEPPRAPSDPPPRASDPPPRMPGVAREAETLAPDELADAPAEPTVEPAGVASDAAGSADERAEPTASAAPLVRRSEPSAAIVRSEGRLPARDVRPVGEPRERAMTARSGALALLAGGLVAALMAGWMIRPDEPTVIRAPAVKRAPRRVDPPPEPTHVELVFHGVPDGATVLVDGMERASPISLDRSDVEHEIVVRTDDGREWSTRHSARTDGIYLVEIEPPPSIPEPVLPVSPISRWAARRAPTSPGAPPAPRAPIRRDPSLMRDPGF